MERTKRRVLFAPEHSLWNFLLLKLFSEALKSSFVWVFLVISPRLLKQLMREAVSRSELSMSWQTDEDWRDERVEREEYC